MQLIFEKKLSISERDRHWVRIPSKHRYLLPVSPKNFKVVCKKKEYYTYIDDYNRFMLGSRIFNELNLDDVGSIVLIYKSEDNKILIQKKSSF